MNTRAGGHIKMIPMEIYFSLRQKDLVDLEATALSHEFGWPTHDLKEPLRRTFFFYLRTV